MKNSTCLMTLIKKLSLGLLVVSAPQIALADSVPATVTTIKGDVVVTDASGQQVQVTQGSKLPAGDTIKTGSTGTVGLTLVPGAGTVVQPNTTVKISTLDFNKGADGGNNRSIRLNLKNGTLISTLFKKDGHSDFQVATPYGVAAAKGTDWEVTVEGTTLTVSVADGVVTVTDKAGKLIATVPAKEGWNTVTGKNASLPQADINAILDAIAAALPNLTQQQVIEQFNNATINPATINTLTNSPTN